MSSLLAGENVLQLFQQHGSCFPATHRPKARNALFGLLQLVGYLPRCFSWSNDTFTENGPCPSFVARHHSLRSPTFPPLAHPISKHLSEQHGTKCDDLSCTLAGRRPTSLVRLRRVVRAPTLDSSKFLKGLTQRFGRGGAPARSRIRGEARSERDLCFGWPRVPGMEVISDPLQCGSPWLPGPSRGGVLPAGRALMCRARSSQGGAADRPGVAGRGWAGKTRWAGPPSHGRQGRRHPLDAQRHRDSEKRALQHRAPAWLPPQIGWPTGQVATTSVDGRVIRVCTLGNWAGLSKAAQADDACGFSRLSCSTCYLRDILPADRGYI